MFSILHISDLHRSPDDPIDNSTLLEALIADRERYVRNASPVRSPDAIIVSGDIIQGVPLGSADCEREIEGQYETAKEFLTSLCESFLDGDKARLVLCPGNHDVCWNTAFASMQEIASVDLGEIHFSEFYKPDSEYRWCWKTKKAYRITDKDTYNSRLDQYRRFESAFYEGSGLAIPLVPDHPYNLFELNDGKIIVAAFDSTFGNDCFAFHGAIQKETVSECKARLRELEQQYLLQIAVWHHGLYGPPQSTDYMDVGTVHQMIGMDFRLGLHGHQHTAQTSAHYIHLPEQVSMPVVSAGSLCAGRRELPVGLNRQYNIIEIIDDYMTARVHVRERSAGEQFQASLKPEYGINGTIDVAWSPKFDDAGRAIDVRKSNLRTKVIKAEQHIANGEFKEAKEALAGLNLSAVSFAREVYLSACTEDNDWNSIVHVFTPPKTYAELVALVQAHKELGEYQAALDLLSHYGANYSSESRTIEELGEKIRTTMEMKKNV